MLLEKILSLIFLFNYSIYIVVCIVKSTAPSPEKTILIDRGALYLVEGNDCDDDIDSDKH